MNDIDKTFSTIFDYNPVLNAWIFEDICYFYKENNNYYVLLCNNKFKKPIKLNLILHLNFRYDLVTILHKIQQVSNKTNIEKIKHKKSMLMKLHKYYINQTSII